MENRDETRDEKADRVHRELTEPRTPAEDARVHRELTGISDEDIENWFTYHQPSQDQIHVYNRVREQGRKLAYVIRDNCPPGPDTTVAIRKLRETIMAANQAIACDPESQ